MLCHACAAQTLDHRGEQRRRNGEIERGPRRAAKHGLQCIEGGHIVVVAIDVIEQCQQALERGGVVDAALVVFVHQALAHVAVPFGLTPRRGRDANHRHRQMAFFHHRIQRRKDLLAGEVPAEAEDHECVRLHPLSGRDCACEGCHSRTHP